MVMILLLLIMTFMMIQGIQKEWGRILILCFDIIWYWNRSNKKELKTININYFLMLSFELDEFCSWIYATRKQNFTLLHVGMCV